MKKNSKNFITLFFVALFLLFKVAGLHVLSHDDHISDIQHCEVCEISTSINFTPHIKTETTVLTNSYLFFLKQPLNFILLVAIFNNKYLSGYLFTRPPPQYL